MDTRQRSWIFSAIFSQLAAFVFLITPPPFLIGIVKLGFIKSTCPLHGHHHNCFCQNARLCRLHALSQLDDASSLKQCYLNSLKSNEIIKNKWLIRSMIFKYICIINNNELASTSALYLSKVTSHLSLCQRTVIQPSLTSRGTLVVSHNCHGDHKPGS